MSRLVHNRELSELEKKPSILDRLPVELYQSIAECITNKADLYILLFVSKPFRDAAESFLYRTIYISRLHHIKTRLQLFNHLAECNRVASYVRHITIESVDFPEYFLPITTEYWLALNRALCAVNHLTSLALQMYGYLPDGLPDYPPFCLFSRCTFQVQSLSIMGLRDLNRPALEQQMVVTRLCLDESDLIGTFSPNAFSKLSSLWISDYSDLLSQLISKRKVKTLLSRVEFISPTIFNDSVTSLHTLPCIGETPPKLPKLHLSFPSLRYLHLSAAPSFFQSETSWTIPEMLGMFSKLSKLQKLVLILGFDIVSQDLQPHLFFNQVASLQVLVVGFHPKHHVEWVRGVTYSTAIQLDDEEWDNPRWH